MVALALAYSQFRKGEPGLISRTLRPLLGDKVEGPIGTLIDVLSVFATLVGVAVSLGMGRFKLMVAYIIYLTCRTTLLFKVLLLLL